MSGTLEELGRDRFRATVGICPECLSLYDGAYLCGEGPWACLHDGATLEIVRVRIADD